MISDPFRFVGNQKYARLKIILKNEWQALRPAILNNIYFFFFRVTFFGLLPASTIF
jgi:hypothetical protein